MAANETTVAGEVELEVIARLTEAWNRQDIEGFLDCLTDDVHWDDPPMPAPADDKAAVRRWCMTTMGAFAEMTFSVRCVYRGPAHSYAVNWSASATMTGRFDPPGFAPTGRSLQFDGVDLVEFREGRICRIVTHFDGMRLGERAGLMPARPRPGSAMEWLAVRVQHVVAWFQRRRNR